MSRVDLRLHLVSLLCVLISGMVTQNVPSSPPGKPILTKSLLATDDGRYWTRDGRWLTFSCRADRETSNYLKWSSLYLNGVKIVQMNGTGSKAEFNSYSTSFREAGNYTCTFSNSQGESPHSDAYPLKVFPLVPDAPEVVLGRHDYQGNLAVDAVSLVKGTTTNDIYCKPKNRNEWDRNCVLYINNQRYAHERYCGPFTIPHTESGEYTCTMSSSTETGPKSPVKIITFLDRPVIHRATSSAPKLAQPYSLTCNTSSSNITMSWYIGPEHNKTLLDYADSDTLQFDTLGPMDEQVYYCKIAQGLNEAWSKPFPLYFSKPAKPHLTRSKDEDETDRNSTQLHCLSDVTGTYHLYKDGLKMASKFGINQSFVVFSSETTDGSKFTCTVSSEGGESEHSNVQFINSKDLQLIASQSKAKLGESLNLTCVSKSNLEGLTYSWKIFRANGTVSRPQQGQTLILNPVSEADAGIYTCEAEVHGVAMTSLAPLYNYHIVFDPPTSAAMIEVGFVDNFSNEAFKPIFTDLGLQDYGGSFVNRNYYLFSCICNGYLCDPKYGFKLYKNNKKVTFVRHTDSIRYTETSCNITRFYAFDITKTENDGTYTCTALNAVDESEPSNPIIISTSRVLTSPILTADNPEPTIGQSITLTCNVPSMIPDFDIKWKKWFSTFFHSGRNLHLSNLTAADRGLYECSYARPGSGDEFYKYASEIRMGNEPFDLILTALRPPILHRYIYPKDDEQDSAEYYVYGYRQRILFLCYEPYIFNDTRIEYRFYRDGSRIGVSSDGTFTLPDLPVGVYNVTCTMRHPKFGESEMSYPSILKIEARPTISASIDTPPLNRGVTVTLTCNVAHASDGRDIVWRKNEKLLAETSVRLTLTNVSDCDRGVYQCRQIVGIWHQALSEEYHLNFGNIAKPEIFTYDGMDENRLSTALNPGSSLILYCVTASLMPILPIEASTAVFYRDGVKVGSSFFNFLTDIDDTLCKFRLSHTIQPVSKGDSGRYTCVMNSSLGMSEESDALTIHVGNGNGGGNAAVQVHANALIIVLQIVPTMFAVVSLRRLD